MKKLGKLTLKELNNQLPVIDSHHAGLILGGMRVDGSGITWYTWDEMNGMVGSGTWTGGFVDGTGYVGIGTTVTGSYGSTQGSGSSTSFNLRNALSTLNNNALSTSSGYCARYVRLAIEAGGTQTEGRPSVACDYDTYLTTIGFHSVPDGSGYVPQAGDIVVFEAIEGHPYGHIAMYNGQNWVSDFIQNDMYGGSAYRTNTNSRYTILRHN